MAGIPSSHDFLSNLCWLQTAISWSRLPISTCRIYTSRMIYIVPSDTGSSASRLIETVSRQCQTVLRIPQMLFHNIIWHTFPSLQLFITASNLHKEDSSYPTGGPTAIHFSDMVHQSLSLLCGRDLEVVFKKVVHFGIKVTDGENKKCTSIPKYFWNMVSSGQLQFFLLGICIWIAHLAVTSGK